MSLPEYRSRDRAHADGLVDTVAIAAEFGVERRTPSYWAKRPGFPRPVAALSTGGRPGRLWLLAAVQRFVDEQQEQDESAPLLVGGEWRAARGIRRWVPTSTPMKETA